MITRKTLILVLLVLIFCFLFALQVMQFHKIITYILVQLTFRLKDF